MLKVMDTGFATDHVAPATILSGSFEETHQAPQPWTEGRDGLERCDESNASAAKMQIGLVRLPLGRGRFIPRAIQ